MGLEYQIQSRPQGHVGTGSGKRPPLLIVLWRITISLC